MSLINLPQSMNLGEMKGSALADCKSSFQRFRSNNATYGAGEIITIEIPTGGRSASYLHAQDSFLELKFQANFTNGSGGVTSIDANAFSLFKSVKVLHGSNTLVNLRDCNKLWNALYDFQVPAGQRNAGQINLMIQTETVASPHCNIYGQQLTSGNVYPVSMTLPIPVLGSLQEKALPLGWLSASSLTLELEVDTMNRILTNRVDSDTIAGSATSATTAPTFTSIVLSDIFYNAKISQISAEYDALLRRSLGDNIVIPATDWKGEFKSVNSGATAFSDKFSYQYSSIKQFMWFMCSQDTANGVINGNGYCQAISQRQSGPVKEYFITINGEMFPSQGISMALNNASYITNRSFGNVAYANLLRAFNQNSDTNSGGVIDLALYCNNLTTLASDASSSKRFIGSIDLDRCDGNASRIMQGLNTMNSNFVFNVTWESALSTNQLLYSFVNYDVAYVLQDGLLSVRQ